jgi:hypothetical protein
MKSNSPRVIRALVPLCLIFLSLVATAQSNDKLSQLINDRNDLLNQYDVFSKNDKTFKNKKTIADYQSLIKKIVDLDAQIIGQANFEIEQKEKAKTEALNRLKNKKGEKVVVTVQSNDSLMNVLNSAQSQSQILDAQLKAKSESINQLVTHSDSLVKINKKLQSKFESLTADNESLGQKNLLLILFNSIVIMALIGLLAYMMRKPSRKTPAAQHPLPQPARPINHQQHVAHKTQPVKDVKKEEPVIKISSEGILQTTNDSLDNKLEQIEKLAKLREKGYLTDEEFMVQKKQILGQ